MSCCQRCKQPSSGPQAFLLTCRGCSKTWHHRCHMPPVGDGELIQRIRATNVGDTANDLSAWTCRRCKKGASETPSAMSSREPTASSDSREDRKSLTLGYYSPAVTDITTSTSTASVASTVDVRVKQESNTAVDARLLNDRERNKKSDRRESTEAAPAKRVLSAKRTKPSAANRAHVQPQPGPAEPRDADVQMADTTPTKFTPQGKKTSPQRPSSPTPFRQGKSARKFVNTVPATPSKDDVEMKVEVTPPSFSEPTSRATSQASQAPSSDDQAIRRKFIAEAPVHVRTASSTNEREREVRPADGAVIQPRVDQDAANEMNDDPEDLYGPPVERRIIRILPSLAEELREQQRRVAAEKEKRRAPLAPDWIYAKHVHDPLWKEVQSKGRKRRKPTSRKLVDNGLNVDELMGCFTVHGWVREHKT